MRLLSFVLVAVLAAAPGAARADETAEPISGLLIEDAVVTPAPVGRTAMLGFRIDNFSGRSVTLIGARSPRAGSGVLMIGSHGGKAEVATAVSIRQDESLDLRSSHIWIELRDIRQAIEPGDMVPFELIFATGTVAVQAHAHAGAVKGH